MSYFYFRHDFVMIRNLLLQAQVSYRWNMIDTCFSDAIVARSNCSGLPDVRASVDQRLRNEAGPYSKNSVCDRSDVHS